MKKGICLSAALAALVALLTSCFIPESFTATMRITKDYHYSAEYSGTLIFMLALEKIQKEGKLSPADDAVFMASTESAFKKEDGFQSAAYKGGGRWKVKWKDEGTLTNKAFFLDSEMPIVIMQRLQNNGISFKGMRLTEKDLSDLKEVKVTIGGKFEVITDCKVTEHNATEKPTTRGGFTTYTWVITADKVSSPFMLLETPSTVPLADGPVPAVAARPTAPNPVPIKPTIAVPPIRTTVVDSLATSIGEGAERQMPATFRAQRRVRESGDRKILTLAVPGTRAECRITNQMPVFGVSILANATAPEKWVRLVRLNCDGNERSADVGSVELATNTNEKPIDNIPVHLESLGPMALLYTNYVRYRVTLKSPLKPGEYLIEVGGSSSVFGVDDRP